jgi:hypothetical protein
VDYLRPDVAGPQALWAKPIIEDAAAWMRALHERPALRQRIGTAAKARIAAYQAEAWGRPWVDEMIAFWVAQTFLPGVPGKYSYPLDPG